MLTAVSNGGSEKISGEKLPGLAGGGEGGDRRGLLRQGQQLMAHLQHLAFDHHPVAQQLTGELRAPWGELLRLPVVAA